MPYKRNQVEDAISRILEPSSQRPGSELRNRMKRLLDSDRGRDRAEHSARHAFYTGEPPGRGVEVWFSPYEAFALLMGLMLINHGWPQGLVVDVLRRARPKLEKHQAEVLREDPQRLFDQAAVLARARPGALVVSNTSPVFLAISWQGSSGQLLIDVCRGEEELMPLIRNQGPGLTWTLFEIATRIHDLSSTLAMTKARKRGRTTG